MQALSATLLMLAALGPLGVALATALAPAPTGPVAAVFPPWWNSGKVMEAAGSAGAVIRFGAFPFVVIVSVADRSRLQSSGAWLILDPRAIGGCSRPAS